MHRKMPKESPADSLAIVLSLLFILCLSGFSTAQETAITGTVVDKDQNPAAGCVVTLTKAGIRASTGADGKFNMTDGTPAGHTSRLTDSRFSYVKGNLLHFTAEPGRHVQVSVYNAAGALVARPLSRRVAGGKFILDPFEGMSTSSGIYLVLIVMGEHRATYVMPRIGSGQARFAGAENSPASSPSLRKSAVTNDILSIECDGIWQKSLDVTSSGGDLGAITVFGKPNIIFINTDDQSYWETGTYGNPVIKMPVLDSMALRGVVFKYAYNPSNICQPSRASVMLSQFAGTHRSGFEQPTQLSISRAEFAKSYPVMLRRQGGYKSAFLGKFGFAVTQEKLLNMIGKFQLWKQDSCYPKDEFDYSYFLPGQGSHWPDGTKKPHLSKKLAALAIDFINKHKDSPMLISLFEKSPHTPYSFDPEYSDIYKGVTKFPRHPNDGKSFRALLPKVIQQESRCGSSPGDAAIASRGKMVYGVDVTLGKIRDELKRLGLLDNTVFIYTSDNGYALGGHGCDRKDNLYDHFSRVPFIIVDPRMAPSQRGKWITTPVMSLDIGPTMLEMVGLTPPSSMHGISLLPTISTDRKVPRESIFQENYFTNRKTVPLETANATQAKVTKAKSWRAKGVRSERWHYIRYYELDPVVEELFDISSDTLEINNLSNDPQYADALDEMRKKCDAWMKLAEDARIDNK